MAKVDIAKVIEFVPKIISLVSGIKALFGHKKSGAEKKEIAMQTVLESEGLIESLAGKDLINSPALTALASEAIELGVQVMKAKERLAAIAEQIHLLRVNTKPADDGA